MTRPDMALDDVTAIVVHHRSYDGVPTTVRSLIAQGLKPERVLLVDNSEEPGLRARLAESLPAGVEILHVANRGYGAAVNAGLDLLRSRGDEAEYVLVSSHESQPHEAAIGTLRSALEDDPSAAVAGPTLVTGHGSDQWIWSEGGYLTRFTHRPMHHSYGEQHRERTARRPVARQWLDGAFLLYRRAHLESFRFSEDYFLYMEETDLHLRLGRAGRTLLWVPDAVAWQSSQGVPAYWFARNLRLLYARTDTAWRRRFVARALVLRRLAGAVLKGRGAAEALPLLKGSMVRLPVESTRPQGDHLAVVNPLGAALHHYQAELVSVLSADSPVTVLSTSEPSAGNYGRVGWLASYLVLLAKAAAVTRRGSRGELLVVWPVLGYLDLVLLRAVAGRHASFVLHDPVPLVPAVGYGRLARRIGVRLGAGVRVIVHSTAASRALDPGIDKDLVTLLPHPILPPRSASPEVAPAAKPVIRVLGQYKPDRDVDALAGIAQHFGTSVVLEIHGRGWPTVAGWSVQSRFVTEEEMDALIASSDVVVIPYRRFYQSGIAIRCLEHGTPVVGPAGSSLEDLYGSESRLLARDADDWVAAVAHAATEGRREARAAAQAWWAGAHTAWREWRAK